jgi:hypothetical protein
MQQRETETGVLNYKKKVGISIERAKARYGHKDKRNVKGHYKTDADNGNER